jgi:hypothetical protein
VAASCVLPLICLSSLHALRAPLPAALDDRGEQQRADAASAGRSPGAIDLAHRQGRWRPRRPQRAVAQRSDVLQHQHQAQRCSRRS